MTHAAFKRAIRACLFAASCLTQPLAATPMQAPHVEAELVSENAVLAPGENWLALRLAPESGWHTYWRDPGDTGLPTTLRWRLPEGFSSGDIVWPAPETFSDQGVTTFGYAKETLHLVALTVPPSAAGSTAHLQAQANWLACAEQCIPGKATLSLDLPVAAAAVADPRWAPRFAATRAQLSTTTAATAPAAPEDGAGLLLILGFAVLGGLILNLMPCVFPVLSIKAVSVLEARGHEAHRQKGHALAYATGVIGSCVVAALAILGLRASGEALGWGFQLQSPVFVAVLAYLIFALGLSMSGLVHFGTTLMGVGQSLTVRGGYTGSFFTGVLAVVVASPCTAPFMGSALGYALTQPPEVSLLVFAALGLGLALPFLLVGFVPAVGRMLPRPGRWMETFKQVMAFPLYLTAVWLAWVLGRQAGVNAMGLVLIGMVLIALAAWLLSRDGLLPRGLRYAAVAAALALLFLPAMQAVDGDAPRVAAETDGWSPYSDQRLDELRAEGRAVFVNLTADWCLTCKVNERMALDTTTVRDAFSRRHVALLKGDWTRSDPLITKVLERFGRPGVPLYVLYPPRGEPVALPQLLTVATIVDALEAVPD